MTSQAAQPSLILVRRLPNGAVEWIPLETGRHITAAAGAAYTVIDRADYEAPQTLVVEHQDTSLVVEVQGQEVLTLDGFFATEDVTFYPTTNIAGGAGPFSGSALTPDSPLLADSPAGEHVVWAAEGAPAAGTAESGAAAQSTAQAGAAHGGSALLWGGLALGGVGLLAAAGGGGGSGGGSDGGGGGGGGGDTTAPRITSGATADAIPEDSGAGQVVYTGTATDAGAVNWSLKTGGDATAFSIDPASGEVTLTGNPDFEAKPSYSFTVVATDTANNHSEQAVTLTINNLDEVAPTITSGATAATIPENSGAGQVVYTVTSTDDGDIHTGSTVYSLKPVDDAASFTVDSGTGDVTLINNPDFETKPSYSFTVLATDRAGNSTEQAVSLSIENGDDSAPFITSLATATPIDENSGPGQAVYTATATDDGTVTWSLKASGDAGVFTIDAGTGEVILTDNPDFETKSSYSFTVMATDNEGNVSAQPVTLNIINRDEVAPTITSGGTAPAINENSGAGKVVYTVTSTDIGDIHTGTTTYSLKPVNDASAFSIDPSSGAVALIANPDAEAKSSYHFTVVATDAANNFSEQAVSLAINDVDDSAPTITSGATATAIAENSGPDQVVYTVTSTDTGDISTGSTVYSLKPGGDASAFTIDSSTGKVTLTGNPNFETKPSYHFTVMATDAAHNSSQQAVTLNINNLDEVAPTITSGTTAPAVNENSGAGQVIYTVTSTDNGDIHTGSTSYAITGADAGAFTIDASTGEVTLVGNPDFETKSSYSFTAVATDAAGNSSQRAVTLSINNLDESAPTITSGATAPAVDENSAAGQTVYTATATDDGPFTWSLQAGGDASAFSIDTATGAVTLKGSPNFEAKPSYTFTVVATDAADNNSQQAVTLNINNLDEVAPTITSGATATAIAENSGPGQVVYTVTSTDTGDISTGSTVYSLKPGGDASAFTIDSSTGKVTLTGNPNFEANPSYTFTVVATDAADNSSQQAVTLNINNLDEVAPTITSGTTAPAVDENSGTNQTVYTVTSTDNGDIHTGSTVYSLKPGDDSAAFGIDGNTGAVALIGNPDFETQPSYNFTVVATDTAGNSSEQAVSLAINDLDESPPTLSSSTPADNASGVAVGDDIVLTFSENVVVGSGNITISDGSGDTRSISANDSSQVSVSGDHVTIDPSANLIPGSTYSVQIDGGALTDAAGNGYAGISNTTDLNFDTANPDSSIVVFDLVDGTSSDHSGRTFDAGISYTIYVRVDSTNPSLSTDGDGPAPGDSWDTWSAAGNLGSDDRIVLVGSGSNVQGPGGAVNSVNTSANAVSWAAAGSAAVLAHTGHLTRVGLLGGSATASLWTGSWGANPDAGSALNQVYLAAMPAGVLTSQGLA